MKLFSPRFSFRHLFSTIFFKFLRSLIPSTLFILLLDLILIFFSKHFIIYVSAEHGDDRETSGYRICPPTPADVLRRTFGDSYDGRHLLLQNDEKRPPPFASEITMGNIYDEDDFLNHDLDPGTPDINSPDTADLVSEDDLKWRPLLRRLRRQKKSKNWRDFFFKSRTLYEANRRRRAPLTCDTVVEWIDLGPYYEPRYVKSHKCTSERCYYGSFVCRPITHQQTVLRLSEQCAPLELENIPVVVACQCQFG